MHDKKFQPKRLRRSIKRDPVSAETLRVYNLPWACEDCTHFAAAAKSCTLGFNSKHHLRLVQQKSYELRGQFALCRYQEID